ncbi:MAG: alanine dehydrogenase [Legionellales bacterium]|nr:alanine dehydrogenase [Legionellales bacterium]
MKIGVPKEIKNHEYRVGLVPRFVRELVAKGHEVLVEKNAGIGIGMTDEDYREVGAQIAETAAEVFDWAEMIVKVKEPQPNECQQLKEDQILFTYLHLAPDPAQTQLLMDSGCIAIAYETVTDQYGRLPLLTPMSEVAGRLAVQAGAHCLEKINGGRGVLLGGVPGVLPARVLIIGGGVSGTQSIRMALGLEAEVTVIERSIDRMRELKNQFGSRIRTVYSSSDAIEVELLKSDLVIGAVLIPGAAAPKLVTRENMKMMQKGAVFVDVAIDQGGCAETSKPTTHSEPTYIEEDVVHYCVTNMPGAVPRTSTFALNNATIPYIQALAALGAEGACRKDIGLLNGVNICRGQVTQAAVAECQDRNYVDPLSAL